MCVFLEFFNVWYLLGIFFCWWFVKVIMNKVIEVFVICSFNIGLGIKGSLWSSLKSVCVGMGISIVCYFCFVMFCKF